MSPFARKVRMAILHLGLAEKIDSHGPIR